MGVKASPEEVLKLSAPNSEGTYSAKKSPTTTPG